ncbi:hypothetical protein AX15_006455 [Amanita polypyramis BW_CC]|nr:hypothetical protein AX15_006455 [Amanita polypyramis BW_CC]
MASRTLQPSELEIQREVEALRDIRRRSIAPGALTIDPDLPPNQSPPSPSQSYWSNPHSASTDDGDSSNSSHEGNFLPRRRSSRSSTGSASDDPSAATDDPFHLFWVPASLHPEIAPAEFRAFLKEHARAPPPSDEVATSRSDSSSGLARRKSMLSRQYLPSENDNLEDEKIVPLKRNRSNLLPNRGPQLTIKDLEKLEQLAEEASNSDDPSKFRNILRRSLSLNLSPSALSHMQDVPDIADEADSPIIVPPPGQILRRAARTKIRKPGLPGDGGGHRFSSTRRAQVRAATAPLEPRTSSDRSSSEHGESIESVSATPEPVTSSRDKVVQRPESYSEEAFIIDAYVRDDDEELHPPKVSSPEPTIADLPESTVSPPLPPTTPQLPIPDVHAIVSEASEPMLQIPDVHATVSQAPEPVLHLQHTATSQPLEPTFEPIQVPSTAPAVSSPQAESSSISTQQPVLQPLQPPQPVSSIPPAPSPPPQKRRDKDKKGGLFGKWGGDKASKKAQKNTSSEKETGFFGSLFGGSKKKQDSEPVSSTAGRETAQALLGVSKSKNHTPPTSSGLLPGVPPNNYSRYPIHVERAIYRLSHIKLANPRRPLYEQVLISNLMFWYLGVINKAQSPTQQPNGQPTPNAGTGQPTTRPTDGEGQERDQIEREKAERERLERERLETEQRERAEREAEMKKKESGRRGSLTKSPPVGAPSGGGRRAEKPVKGPQYEIQHRVMEQEYSNYAAQTQQGMPLTRINSAPVGGTNTGPGQQHTWGSSNLVQPQPQPPIPNHIYSREQSPPPRKNTPSPSSAERRSQSPPTPNSHRPMNTSRYSPNSSQENLAAVPNGRLSGRSLSATAVPSPPMYQVNGRVRKGASAYASIPSQEKRPRSSEDLPGENGFEEEDVPLAVWQQQRRR